MTEVTGQSFMCQSFMCLFCSLFMQENFGLIFRTLNYVTQKNLPIGTPN